MKKITLLLMAAAVSFAGYSQTEEYVSQLGENNPVIYVDQGNEEAPCSQSGQTPILENGKSCTQNLLRIVAHDLTVADGEDLTLETFTGNFFIGATGSGVNAAFVDFYVWGDAGGAPDPGNLITSELALVPDSQTVVGSNFGFDSWEVVLDVTDVLLAGQTGSTTTYWVGIALEATDASNVFWENSTAGLVGFGEAYDDGTGGGFVIDNALEGIYTADGDCEPLNVNDNALSQISVYPNPVNDVLNIKTPGNVQIQSAVIYDVLGKATNSQVINGQINVGELARGVYILNLNTSAGTLTQKIIKQ